MASISQRILSLLITLLFGYELVIAQHPHIKFLSLEQGLSNANALDIIHDDQGIAWIATELGLNKFAGNTFYPYYKSEQQTGSSVNSHEINKLLYDDQHIYIGTRADGLNIFDINTGEFSYYKHNPTDKKSIATNDITDIRKGHDGAIWLSTYHRGIERFDQLSKEFQHFNTQNVPGMSSNSVWSIVEDQQGRLYCGHVNDGISILNTQKRTVQCLQTDGTARSIPHNEVKVLWCDRKNNIWIGTRKGLAVYNPNSKKIKRINLSKQDADEPFIYSITEINDEIWVGTESSQIHIIRPTYQSTEHLPDIKHIQQIDIGLGRHISVQKIASDRFGNIWLAFYGGGIGFISHLHPFFNTTQGTNAIINGIVNGPNEAMWLLTEGQGLLQVGSGESSSSISKLPSGLQNKFLWSGFQDSHKNIWVGLKNQGVSFFDTKTRKWKSLKREPFQEVRTMTEDRNGHIWMGTRDGLVIYDPIHQQTEKLSIHEPALGDYAPRALAEDMHGNMWVGTYGQGVYVFDYGKKLIAHFTAGNKLKSNSINHLFRDHDNNIWIATNEGLAYQAAETELGTLRTIIPPKSNAWLYIQAISQDKNGAIWCSTKAGLLRYLPEENRFFSYDRNFGIPVGGFQNSSVATNEQGLLFFGMQDGICFFDPAHIPVSLSPSPLYISSLTAFGREETPQQTEKYTPGIQRIQLADSENSFRLAFGVADYALQGLTEFSYQLKGRDDEWAFIGNEQVLNFRNIPYGNYELLIRTRQKNETWSTDITRLSIHIKPPFYWRVYAKVCYALLGGGILFAIIFFYRRKIKAEGELRLKKLEHQQQQALATERLNFFTNITHELRTPLTLILGPLDDLLQENKLSLKQQNAVQIVQKSANRLFSLVNQLLEFRKVESQHKPLVLGEGYLGEMIQDVVDKYIQLNTKSALEIRCQIPAPDIRTSFDAEIIQIILDNLLSNAYKYTTAGTIDVSLSYEQEQLSTWSVFRISDTGCGINTEYLTRIFDRFFQIEGHTPPGTGIGLAIVKELVAVHYGKIEVTSAIGEGSEFCVRLLTNPVKPLHNQSYNATETTSATSPQPAVLLVEDDTDLRTYLSAVLADQYTVYSAANGREGFEIASEQIPDLIISDVMMADMDGFEMTTKLKESTSTSHIPIILFTAKDRDVDRQKGYEIGVESYLTKPVRPTLLFKRIENILSNRKHMHDHLSQKLRSTIPPTDPDAEKGLWRENTFVQEFIAIVERHMQDDILDAVHLAEKMNMSQSTLYRKLKALTGKSINQLVRKIRVQKAAALLQSGQYNVTEVSFLVGIHSPIYFRQCFKEEFGTLPSEYLKNTPKTL